MSFPRYESYKDSGTEWLGEVPNHWEALEKNHGAQAVDVLLGRLRDSLNQRGTLDVLRFGLELLGLRQPLALAQFKPALAMNPDILARYAANGCGSCGKCVIRCTMKTPSTLSCSSTAFPLPRRS